ncbi:MAG: Tn7 transposase TnsA N-terminal domain-containing protein [Chloroflexi bacterium]|nr:Tn7 transposase TnsA N-terminal domain-containing protein [Chloroflexota bacterium]
MGFNRKPPTDNSRRVHSNGQTLCGVVTNKAGRTVQFESFAERSLLLRLDRSADVQDYLSQPDPISYRDPSGKGHLYTPDFKVWHTDGRISLHEVTLAARSQTPPLQQRHTAAAQFCRERGWQYHLHTETTLPQGANWQICWHCGATVRVVMPTRSFAMPCSPRWTRVNSACIRWS